MSAFLTDLLLLFLLTVLNGVFAMSEIALVSSRKVRLQSLSDEGSSGAKKALELYRSPSRFLSTIQVGITSIGILSGAVGEKAISAPLAGWLTQIPGLQVYARGIALAVTVVCLTYFSVVIGELVPKSLALLAPERLASIMSRPLGALAVDALPLVWLLSKSSEWFLGMLGVRKNSDPPISDNEIRALMGQGTKAGVFHKGEQEIVSNVLRLDQQPIVEIMTPKHDLAVLDLDDTPEVIRNSIASTEHTRLIVCRDGLQHVLGILRRGDLLGKTVNGTPVMPEDIESVLLKPLFVPETISTIQLLENFRHARNSLALVVDEYGDMQGIVTMTDVLAAIVGDSSVPDVNEEDDLVRREDGSWLVDGEISIERLVSELGIHGGLPGEDSNRFHTVGGFVMYMLGRIPVAADRFEAGGWRFEVMDMDRNRVDKVLVVPPETDGNVKSE